MKYGYARVSTKEQNEQRQIAALEEFGLSQKQIFMDKQSGKDFAHIIVSRNVISGHGHLLVALPV